MVACGTVVGAEVIRRTPDAETRPRELVNDPFTVQRQVTAETREPTVSCPVDVKPHISPVCSTPG